MGSACLVLAVALLGGGGRALSLLHYRQAVHVQRLALDRLATHHDTAGLGRVQSRLRSLALVRLPDGEVVHTDLPFTANLLTAADPGSVRLGARRLDRLDDSLRGTRVSSVPRSELATLDVVLRDRRFHPARPPWAPITDKIAELQNRLLEWLLVHASESAGSTGIFAVLLLLAVAGLGYLLARGALGRMVSDVTADEPDRAPTTSVSAEERARASSAAGDYREALRYLFLGTLLALQERGVLELRPGMTNREYIASARAGTGGAAVSAALTDLVDMFDRVWYGHMPCTAAEYERCRTDAERALGEQAQGAA